LSRLFFSAPRIAHGRSLPRSADEVWGTRSTREIVPVTRIDGQAEGAGVPGPAWRRMHAADQAFKQKIREGKA